METKTSMLSRYAYGWNRPWNRILDFYAILMKQGPMYILPWGWVLAGRYGFRSTVKTGNKLKCVCHLYLVTLLFFFNFFFYHSTLRFNLYLHWVILVCKCISPVLLLEIPLDLCQFPWQYSLSGSLSSSFFIIYFLGECLVFVFKNKLARHGSDEGTLVKVNLSVLMLLVAEFSVIVSIAELSWILYIYIVLLEKTCFQDSKVYERAQFINCFTNALIIYFIVKCYSWNASCKRTTIISQIKIQELTR